MATVAFKELAVPRAPSTLLPHSKETMASPLGSEASASKVTSFSNSPVPELKVVKWVDRWAGAVMPTGGGRL